MSPVLSVVTSCMTVTSALLWFRLSEHYGDRAVLATLIGNVSVCVGAIFDLDVARLVGTLLLGAAAIVTLGRMEERRKGS